MTKNTPGGSKPIDRAYYAFIWTLIVFVLGMAAFVALESLGTSKDKPSAANLLASRLTTTYDLETDFVEWIDLPEPLVGLNGGECNRNSELQYPQTSRNSAENLTYVFPDGSFVRVSQPTGVRLKRLSPCRFEMSFWEVRTLPDKADKQCVKALFPLKLNGNPKDVEYFAAKPVALSTTESDAQSLLKPQELSSHAFGLMEGTEQCPGSSDRDLTHEFTVSRAAKLTTGSLGRRIGPPTSTHDASQSNLIRNSGIQSGKVVFYDTPWTLRDPFDSDSRGARTRYEVQSQDLLYGDVVRIEGSPKNIPSAWGTITLQSGDAPMLARLRSQRATATIVNDDTTIKGETLLAPNAWTIFSRQPIVQMLFLLFGTLATYFSFLRVR
ncbi:hypothetical protein [Asticcacaulis sp. W401b]|uniref:hypothetical protein n=1 Tax=Asticcacaulis sp. W401b TaxID=3388666 RepID=UPI0039711134